MFTRVGLAVLIIQHFVVGCAGGKATEGSGLPNIDPQTLRRVQRQIEVTDMTPVGVKAIGEVECSRGHRSTLQREPTEADVVLDLKCAAYAVGADGISQIKIVKKSGLMNNYWWVLEGRAFAWQRLDNIRSEADSSGAKPDQ